MAAFANPYVLIILLLIGVGYETVEAVKKPVETAIHQVEKAGKKVLHVVTFGKK